MELIATPISTDIVHKGRWQRQSNPNPWDKKETPQWESYSLEHNYLIEKAYYDQQKEVDVGDYIISIKHMIQNKKDSVISQRPIRRIDETDSIHEINRSERYFETELPKTMNEVFGTLEDFVGFFSRRSPEISEFARQFEKIEKSDDLGNLNKEIIPQVTCCLEEELLKSISEQLQDPSLAELKRKLLLRTKERHEELISLFQKEFLSFEEFYGKILKAYTMNTCLYENLNRYLRNESWVEIDKIIPYAFCLCKAFFNTKLQSNLFPDKEAMEAKSITVYRGTAFDELTLSCYDGKQLFSWNSVTSTSTNREVAQNFMYQSVDFHNKKYPVLFIIEIPLLNGVESDYLRLIDIHQYSAIPKENEAILPPGSVFEVMEVSTNENKQTTIKLKLKSEVKSLAQGGKIMQGALQSKMMNKKEVNIVCLEGEELRETLKCLVGNKLIEQVEFCLCKFDNRLFEEMVQTLSTLEKTRALKFVSCKYHDEKMPGSEKRRELKKWNIMKIEIFEMDDFSQVFLNKDGPWTSLSKFYITFINRRKTKHPQLLQKLQNFHQLASLAFGFNWFQQMTSEEIDSFAFENLKYFTQLASLTLDFFQCKQVINGKIIALTDKGLRHLSQLTSLNINFSYCWPITDEEIRILGTQGLQNLLQLTSLTLDFSESSISNSGVFLLATEGLSFLTKLASLTLNFSSCREITGEGLGYLAFDGFSSLTSLSLNLSNCQSLTDEGIGILGDKVLQHLVELTSINLSFRGCRELTDKGVKSLVSQGIQHLSKLTSLTLHFQNSGEITEVGLSSLAEGLRHLGRLTFLALYFVDCRVITDKGVHCLASEGLQYLTTLESLTLDFSICYKITDEGIHSFATEGLRSLINLTSMRLCFPGCNLITDKGVLTLASEGLKHLTKLTVLRLHFLTRQRIWHLVPEILVSLHRMLSVSQIQSMLVFESDSNHESYENFLDQKALGSDKGRWILTRDLENHNQLVSSKESTCSFGSDQISLKRYLIEMTASPTIGDCPPLETPSIINQFSHLTSLNLAFSSQKKITDEGILNLAVKGLQHLKQLTSLALDFAASEKITDQGIQSLAVQGLQHLKQLTSLTLDFTECTKITDKGIYSLAVNGLQHLKQLRSLAVESKEWCQISDYGIRNLASQGLQYLKQLQSLTLSFCNSRGITSNGICSLAFEGLKNLIQLESLTLDLKSCYEIKSEGLESLASEGLKNLIQLKSLTLDFKYCSAIESKGLEGLAFQGLQHLTSLTSLKLDFGYCHRIDEGICILGSQGIRHLSNLSSLEINLFTSNLLTDKAIQSLATEGLRYLTKLTSLSLDFNTCQKLTGTGVCDLLSQGLKSSSQLKYLALDLKNIPNFTDEQIINMASEGLQHLGQLISLSLDFSSCKKITDKGVLNLAAHGLQHLGQLTSLSLDFSSCEKITDEGVHDLAFEGLKQLPQLTSLSLNFSSCKQITDEGVNDLVSWGLKPLTRLISLSLRFLWCDQITEFTHSKITKVLHYFGFTEAGNNIRKILS